MAIAVFVIAVPQQVRGMLPERWSGAGVGIKMLMGAGVPLLENRKVGNFQFHVFDRYEIRIQVFVDFI